MSKRHFSKRALLALVMHCAASGCLRPVCDDAAGACPYARDAGLHPDAGRHPDGGPTGECTIGGETYGSGKTSPDDVCRVCDPDQSLSSWTDLPNGTLCPTNGETRICFGGSCRAGCFIDGGFALPWQPDPAGFCSACLPDVSTSTWSTLPPGNCEDNAHCSIGDVPFPIGANNPDDPSQCCSGDNWVQRLQDGGAYALSVRSRVTGIAIADLDQDGLLDLAISFVEMGVDRPSPQVGVLLRQKDWSFGPVTAYPACLSGGIAAGDLNGDGYPDLVTGTCSDGSINVFINRADGTGSLLPGAALSFPVPMQASSFPLQDFDGDGMLDLVLGGPQAYFLKGIGDGGFADPVGYSFPVPPLGDYSIVAAPFQEAGLDFVIGTRSNAAFNVFLGSRNGSFAAQSTIWNGFSSPGLAAGDFDGDGRTDIALGGAGPDPMSILLGQGGGSFSGQTPYAAAGAGLVALADLDLDGPSEALVAATAPPYELNVLWHVPDGGTTVTRFPLEGLPGAILAGGLSPGAPDVAIGAGFTLQFYTNACRGSFGDSQTQF